LSDFHRKHYKAIAKIISKVENTTIRTMLAENFAILFSEDNELFNRERFLKACGIEPTRPITDKEKQSKTKQGDDASPIDFWIGG